PESRDLTLTASQRPDADGFPVACQQLRPVRGAALREIPHSKPRRRRENAFMVYSFGSASHCSKLRLGMERAATLKVSAVFSLATKSRKSVGVSITAVTSPAFWS